MRARSAGLLLFRRTAAGVELLLVHPGGPFWARKDDGAWSIPKGEYTADEDAFAAARREFTEEMGASPPNGGFLALGELVQPSRKIVTAFAIEGEFDPSLLSSNSFEMEWPPRSGLMRHFPEVDRAAWFSPDEACRKLHRGQVAFVDRLLDALSKA